MITMENWGTQAYEKLKKETAAVKGRKEQAMAGAVMDAMHCFCQQEAEFAQAVVQGGSFGECMKRVASGVGNSISDLDAYKKAVEFYFPGAEVRMQLTIALAGAAEADPQPDNGAEQQKTVLNLDLDDLFSF